MGSLAGLVLSLVVGVVLGGVAADDELCHPACSCLDTYFDCRKKSLPAIPIDLPQWVEKLNMSNNELTVVEASSLRRLTHLTSLALDGNNLTRIPPLEGLHHLTSLTLARNLISSTEGVEGSDTLQDLDLSRNKIEDLKGSFPPSLTSLNLGGNGVERIEGSMFSLPSLIDLNLARNRVKKLSKDGFSALTSLQRLDLSRNRLEVLDSLRFQEVKKLEFLSLRRNGLRNLSDAAFFGLERLEALQLDGNGIAVVEKRWLYGLKSLKTLNLSRNAIGRIEEEAWEALDLLTLLDLSHNGMSNLGSASLAKLHNLKTLSLSHNRISGIEDGAFTSLSSLVTLDLSHNELSWVVEDSVSVFRGLGSLTVLNLSWNKIRSVDPSALLGLTSLSSLDLSGNPLNWLNPAPFALTKPWLILGSVETFVCDCEAVWVKEGLAQPRLRHRHTSSGISSGPTCGFPPTLKGTLLGDVPSGHLSCPPSPLRPFFSQDPRSETFLMEGKGSLICVAKGPAALQLSLEWRKDHGPLPAYLKGEEVRREENGTIEIRNELGLLNVSWAEGGSYQCVAQSDVSVVYSRKANVTVHLFPTFTKKPVNVTVRLGANAKLECAARGFPTPEIGFQKDGGEDFPAALDRRFHVMPNDDSFFIMEVKVADSGIYACSARNAAGEVKAYASVTVFETPRFSETMKDESGVEGSSAILSCAAAGSPRPTIQWSKDGAPLSHGRFVLTDNGSLLLIKNVEVGDGGRYECLLTNAVGTARASSILTVIPAGGRGLDSSAMTILFVIIAVFCVVGTSAAWVVVIYRTRKRKKRMETTTAFPFVPEESGEESGPSSVCQDSGTAEVGEEDLPEADPLMEGKRKSRKTHPLESFSTFGPRAAIPVLPPVVAGREPPYECDFISLSHPPGREFLTKRTGQGSSSSSGYSSSRPDEPPSISTPV